MSFRHTDNPPYHQHPQSMPQQQEPSAPPPYQMHNPSHTSKTSNPEVVAEIEMLQHRIDELQQSDSTSSNPQPSTTELQSLLSQSSTQSSLPPIPQAPTPDPALISSHLNMPIAIPATDAKLGSPFLRAYAPILAHYDLPAKVFLEFIDGLNKVAVKSPPLHVLGLAGSVTSMVPLATAQIVGTAIDLAANIGTRVVSKGLTETYMRRANKHIFLPRGLKIEIAKLDALAKAAGMPILDARGKIDKNSKLLENVDVDNLYTSSGQQRRLTALSQWIEPLVLDSLPEIEETRNPLSRLSTAASERQREKGEKKLLKQREKAHEDESKAKRHYQKDLRKQDRKEENLKTRGKKTGEELEESLYKIETERRKIEKEYEKETGKLVKDDMEEKALRKILWLVIRNEGDDSGEGFDPYVDE